MRVAVLDIVYSESKSFKIAPQSRKLVMARGE